MANAYDEIEYHSRPFRQTHPDRIAAIARIFGVPAVDPVNARVLDIGCGEGGNLIPMALAMPEAQFYGFDLAEVPVAKANERIRQLGLKNIRIEALDLMAFPENAGEFDYILAHGFYSWIPDFVRAAYLKLLERHLSANGIAYVSFNAYPGARFRHAWRDGAAFHNAVLNLADSRQKAAESCRMLEWMASATQEAGHWSTIAGEMVNAVQTKGANWAAHDDFGPIFEPFYFHQVADAMAAHGMQYLSDAVYSDTLPHNIVPESQQILEGLVQKSILLREQYYDFIELRPFRQSLFCRESVGAIQRSERTDALKKMHFSTPAEITAAASDGSCTVRHPLSGLTVEVPSAMRKILQELKLSWPCSVPFSQISILETDRSKVAELLLRLYGVALIEAHISPQRCGTGAGEKPRAWALSRLEAAMGQPVTTRIHTQGQMDEVSSRLIQRLDGETSREALAAEFNDLNGRLHWLANLGILDPDHS